MLFLILCIFFTVGLFIIFKYFNRFGVNTFQAIVINYWICVLTGLLFIDKPEAIFKIKIEEPWFWVAFLLGILFILTFNLMALGAQKIGVAIATVASKMSLVIPVLASMFLIGSSIKEFSWVNYTGMACALIAIVLTSVKSSESPVGAKPVGLNPSVIFLPLGIFLLSGLIDTLISYANHSLMNADQAIIFPIVTFGIAAITGSFVLIFNIIQKGDKIDLKSVIGGVVLGVPNYFSIYFLVMALTSFNNDGAFMYPLLNIGIILISAFAAVLLFKEKLQLLNKLGIFIAICAIILLSFEEIIVYLQNS